ncbi:MAG: hypothetical protein JWQ89_4063 [Devosia sp.]|uniref:hypothetical protein n=1 Tax=Devosia sp. TaxID=1871048 RepID=UPI00261A60FC|nr:hypothetical protein [Devosia sp.]MDB5542336.1 hypothetical protein [Devosia sp.]
MRREDSPGLFSALSRLLCRLLVWCFALLYLLALLLRGISALGWFGAPSPLAGVFLIVLGLPWTFGAAWVDDAMQPVIAALAPGVTLLILAALCGLRR